MKTTEKMNEKRFYLSPEIELVNLDNDISLTLDSAIPPFGPMESFVTNDFIMDQPIGLI